MRYMSSRRQLLLAAVVLSLASVGFALALSLGTDRPYLPLPVGFGTGPASFLFFALPVAAVVVAGVRRAHSRPFVVSVAALTAAITTLSSWAVWIVALAIACRGGDCFD
jgi:hypothetical protein